jgi:hypothetical protein
MSVQGILETISCDQGGGLAWQTIGTAVEEAEGAIDDAVYLANWAITNATCSYRHVNNMV